MAHQAGVYPGFCSINQLIGILLFPMDGMLVHRKVNPSIKFAGTHLCTWVERGTVRAKCLAQEHNTMFLARARTWTARSGVECTNHEATAPPTMQSKVHVHPKNFFFAFDLTTRVSNRMVDEYTYMMVE